MVDEFDMTNVPPLSSSSLYMDCIVYACSIVSVVIIMISNYIPDITSNLNKEKFTIEYPISGGDLNSTISPVDFSCMRPENYCSNWINVWTFIFICIHRTHPSLGTYIHPKLGILIVLVAEFIIFAVWIMTRFTFKEHYTIFFICLFVLFYKGLLLCWFQDYKINWVYDVLLLWCILAIYCLFIWHVQCIRITDVYRKSFDFLSCNVQNELVWEFVCKFL